MYYCSHYTIYYHCFFFCFFFCTYNFIFFMPLFLASHGNSLDMDYQHMGYLLSRKLKRSLTIMSTKFYRCILICWYTECCNWLADGIVNLYILITILFWFGFAICFPLEVIGNLLCFIILTYSYLYIHQNMHLMLNSCILPSSLVEGYREIWYLIILSVLMYIYW